MGAAADKSKAKAEQAAGLGDKPKANMGRPSSFSDRLAEHLLELATKGATDEEMAEAANVSVSTLKNWKGAHPDFLAALKEAKDVANQLVVASLFKRATGYSHPAIKFFCHEGKIVSKEYTEHYPPDTTAGIFWLKNRDREEWRDASQRELTGPNGGPIVTRTATAKETEAAIAKLCEDAGDAPPFE